MKVCSTGTKVVAFAGFISICGLVAAAFASWPMHMAASAQEAKSKNGQIEFYLKDIREADADLRQRAFWIAYPLGIAAIVVGGFLRRQAVGRGLLLGGIFLLAYGAYMHWDRMELWLRLVSLAIVLVALFILRRGRA